MFPLRSGRSVLTKLLAIAAIGLCAFGVGQDADYNAKFNAWLKTPNEPAKTKPAVVKREFTWLDATPSIQRKDGVRYRDPSIAPWRFTITASIDEARAKGIEKHFGAPMDAIQFSFISEEEKQRCQKLEAAKLRHHGMRIESSADGTFGVLEADYQWLVDSCKEAVAPITTAILRETDRVLKESRAPRVATARDKAAAIFRFIQSIPYELIDDLPDGKDRCGMRTPLITLLKGGDCDSKSALMAALLRSRKIADVVIVTLKARDGSGHALIGARIDPLPGDETIDHQGKTYVLIEAASADAGHDGNLADVGEIGEEWKDFRSRPFEVTPVR